MKLNAIDEDYAAKYQLRADEIRALFLGHTIHGRDLAEATEHSASVSSEGVASMSGDWGNLSGGTFQLKGDNLCLRRAEGTRILRQCLSHPRRHQSKGERISLGEEERFRRQNRAKRTILYDVRFWHKADPP